MKIIEALIRPYKLEEVKTALGDRIEGLTVTEVRGFGRQRGHSEIYRGSEYKVEFVSKLKLEIICKDDEVEDLMALLADTVRTGKIGDGKIFVKHVETVVRIRTDEREN
jgi:nitrogen regulatory protein P-II 1